MTFDDHPLLDCLPIPVDAIVQDGQRMAKQCLQQIFSLLEGRAPALLIWPFLQGLPVVSMRFSPGRRTVRRLGRGISPCFIVQVSHLS
jgi:hypothetical protein